MHHKCETCTDTKHTKMECVRLKETNWKTGDAKDGYVLVKRSNEIIKVKNESNKTDDSTSSWCKICETDEEDGSDSSISSRDTESEFILKKILGIIDTSKNKNKNYKCGVKKEDGEKFMIAMITNEDNDKGNNDNEGKGVAKRPSINEESESEKEVNDNDKKEKGQKVNEDEARALVRQYEGQMTAGKTGEEYDRWRRETHDDNNPFTPDPWKEGEDNYWSETDDSSKAEKQKKKKELFKEPPLHQLFHRNNNDHDNNDEQQEDDNDHNNEQDADNNDHDNEAQQENDEENGNEQETNNENEEESNVRYGIDIYGNRMVIPDDAIIYDRDPYQMDTDQEIDSGDSDLDTEGNIIPGGTRMLTREEFDEYFEHMGETKEEKDDVNMVYDQKQEMNNINNDKLEIWLGDTGALCHVTHNDKLIMNKKDGGNDRIIVGDKRKCEVESKGNLGLISKDNGNYLDLQNIRVVHDIGKNIISIGLLLKAGGIMEGTQSNLLVHFNNETLRFKKNEIDGLYYIIKMKRIQESEYNECNNINNDGDKWNEIKPKGYRKWPKMSRDEAHAKWGHPHLEQLNKMAAFDKIQVYGHAPPHELSHTTPNYTNLTTSINTARVY